MFPLPLKINISDQFKFRNSLLIFQANYKNVVILGMKRSMKIYLVVIKMKNSGLLELALK